MIRHKFYKAERLKSKKIIQELFLKGSSFYSYPLKLFYLPADEQRYSQALFTVSKKKFKNASDRNLIRRRMREAYRLNKHLLPEDKSYYLAWVYVGKKAEIYDFIENKLKKIIHRLHLE